MRQGREAQRDRLVARYAQQRDALLEDVLPTVRPSRWFISGCRSVVYWPGPCCCDIARGCADRAVIQQMHYLAHHELLVGPQHLHAAGAALGVRPLAAG